MNTTDNPNETEALRQRVRDLELMLRWVMLPNCAIQYRVETNSYAIFRQGTSYNGYDRIACPEMMPNDGTGLPTMNDAVRRMLEQHVPRILRQQRKAD